MCTTPPHTCTHTPGHATRAVPPRVRNAMGWRFPLRRGDGISPGSVKPFVFEGRRTQAAPHRGRGLQGEEEVVGTEFREGVHQGLTRPIGWSPGVSCAGGHGVQASRLCPPDPGACSHSFTHSANPIKDLFGARPQSRGRGHSKETDRSQSHGACFRGEDRQQTSKEITKRLQMLTHTQEKITQC